MTTANLKQGDWFRMRTGRIHLVNPDTNAAWCNRSYLAPAEGDLWWHLQHDEIPDGGKQLCVRCIEKKNTADLPDPVHGGDVFARIEASTRSDLPVQDDPPEYDGGDDTRCGYTHIYTVEVLGQAVRYVGSNADDAVHALLTIDDEVEEGYVVAEHEPHTYCHVESNRVECEAICSDL
jgi:hypothetical protein